MSKRARTPSGRRGSKMPSIDDLPNPVAVAVLKDGAKQLMDDISHGMDMTRPGMDLVREVLPATLLMQVVKGTKVDLELDDGTKIQVRDIDMQVAGLGMFAKVMAKLGNEVIGRAVGKTPAPLRLFDAAARAAAVLAPPAPPTRQEVEASDAGSNDEATREADRTVKKQRQ